MTEAAWQAGNNVRILLNDLRNIGPVHHTPWNPWPSPGSTSEAPRRRVRRPGPAGTGPHDNSPRRVGERSVHLLVPVVVNDVQGEHPEPVPALGPAKRVRGPVVGEGRRIERE
jgi:hypothetical protein